MAQFLISQGKNYSYENLLSEVNKNGYYPLLKTSNQFDYFCNLVKALVNDKSLILLDSDLSLSELNGIKEEDINKEEKLEAKQFSTINEMLEAACRSSAHITIFTSGTTGQPKEVTHSVETLMRAVRRGEKYSGQVWAYAYNPTHMAGLQVFFQALFNQNLIVNVFNAGRNEVYQLIERYSISHISATPTFYRLLAPSEKVYTSVKRVTLGGEKSDSRLYDFIHSVFPEAKINNIYASTEAGSLFAAKGDCFQIPDPLRNKFKIVDGELLIHYSLLGRSENFHLDGEFYHSGDLVEWVNANNGLFRFKGRVNELINVGGYKVNPIEVEAVINSLDGVTQSLVYGRANSILGNILCAEVQMEEGKVKTEREIRQYLIDRLQDYKIPRIIKFVDSFSLTRTGKLKRS